MARYTYQDGTIELVVRLLNGDNDLVDPDVLPNTSGPSGPISGITVDIYPPGYDPRNSTVTIADATMVGQIPTREETGIYTFSMEADPDTEYGTWYDHWHWTVDGIAQDYVFEFIIIERTNLESYTATNNHIIRIVLDSSIQATDGEYLSSGYIAHFSYIMSPMYASLRHLELEAGAFLTNVPDDTLASELLYASKDADLLTFITAHDNYSYFEYVRRRYVVCRALFKLLGNLYAQYMKRKRLGDLDVTYGDGLPQKLNQVANCMNEMELVLNAGGNISPHTSLRPETTIPGSLVPDRPVFGRGWQVNSEMPIGNVKKYPSSSHTKTRKTYGRNVKDRKNWTNTR